LVRLKTYHLHVPIVKKSGGLNLLEPCGPVKACKGTPLHLLCKQQIPEKAVIALSIFQNKKISKRCK
jgi:hypothetical protein